MDRLTERLPNGVLRRTTGVMGSVIIRLADYEDTGLMPKEIAVLQDMDHRAKMAEMLRKEDLQAEVERLRLMVKSITGGLDEAIETVHYLETENAKLHKVADAARALVPSEMYQCTRHLYALKHTLDEYDKAKEGQDG